MRQVTLIRGARQLLTLRGANGPRRGADPGNLGIIQDGAVLVAGGAIVEVGPTRRVENLAIARDAEEIDASGCVVLPGLVACGVRLASDAHEFSPRALKAAAQRMIDSAIRHGVSAMEMKAGPGLTETAALKILRVQAALRELPMTLVSTLATSDEGLAAKPRVRRLTDRIEVCGSLAEGQPEVELLKPLAALGGGNPSGRSLSGANDPASMQTAIALACRSMNLSPAEALCAATINAAFAIGQAASIGSIEAGKSADLIILDVPDYREVPYHLGVNLAKLVMIRGSVRAERAEVKWQGR
ncbi:MAG TPA: amidohydrolase family protein [Bryobacteraceae bacterium]|nr:amidohydrolase family protein [Bryobacteraceae bacterium]